MKYIISENRLTEFIRNYLETFVANKVVVNTDSFVVISEPVYGDEENWADYMEYDHTDGRLWINRSFLENFMNLFGFSDKKSAQDFIKDWFENKFGVNVKFVE